MAEHKEDFFLQMFDGTGYDKWRYRLQLFLEMKDCESVILKKERPQEITELDWRKKELKAKNYIVNRINNTQLELIISENTSYQMIKKLDETYLVKSTAMKLLCKIKLLDLKMKETESPIEFFNDFEKLINELRNAGENVTDEDKLNYLLLAIPENVSHIVDIVDALPKGENPIEYVKTKLLFEFKRKEGVEKNSEPHRQFQVFQSKYTRERQTKDSQIHKNIHKPKRDRANDREKQIKCYRCNRPGHTQQYCRSGKTYFKRRDSSHLAAGQASLEEKTDYLSFSVEVMAMHSQQQHNSNGYIKWLLDSGCSHHVINTDKYYSNYVQLEKCINVKVTDIL